MVRDVSRWLKYAPLALSALTVLTYAPSLPNGFTYDDDMVISDASYLLSTPSQISKLISKEYFSLSGESTYRPVTTLSYILDWRIGGGGPLAFHIQSLGWHLLSVLMAWLLYLRIAGASLALPTAALFAIHPAMTEAVDNISFREDLLATALGLASIVVLIYGSQKTRPYRLAAGGALLTLAQLSKETGFAFVFLIPLSFWVLAPKTERYSKSGLFGLVRQRAPELATGALSALTFLVLRFVIFPSSESYGTWPGGSFATGFATGVFALAYDLRLLIVPHPLCADYRGSVAPISTWGDGRFWISLILLLSVLGMALRSIRRAPLVSFGVFWFFIALAPVSNVVPIPVFMADRFLYLPYVGILLTLTTLFARRYQALKKRQRFAKKALFALACVVPCIWLTLTIKRHAAWASNEALWSTTLADHPTAYSAMHGYSVALMQKGQDLFREAQTNPSKKTALEEAIKTLTRAKDLANAALDGNTMAKDERSAALSDLGMTHGVLADIYQVSGRPDESSQALKAAVSAFSRSLNANTNPKGHYNLAIALLKQNRSQEAERELRLALQGNPYYRSPYLPLAELLKKQGSCKEVETLLRRYQELTQAISQTQIENHLRSCQNAPNARPPP